MNLLAFWSYVHADDDVDMGRIVQLARDIVGHYEARTGETIDLFLDRDDIQWGNAWREKIDASLANVVYFVPVITPRYFRRVECRRELQFFANRTQQLGIRDLILPILYIDVPELQHENPNDVLVKLVQDIQWKPWTEWRFTDRDSAAYRSAVDDVARELVTRVAAVERSDIVAATAGAQEDTSDDDDEPPGLLDRIGAMERAMPRWSETLKAIGAEIDRMGTITEKGSVAISRADAQGTGVAARLVVARQVAEQLNDPVSEIERLGQTYASDLADIDDGIRALLIQGAHEAKSGESQEARDQYCTFVGMLRSLAEASGLGLGSLEGLVKSAQPLEALSKDLRPVLRRMRGSLTALVEAREVTQSWVDFAVEQEVDCTPSSN